MIIVRIARLRGGGRQRAGRWLCTKTTGNSGFEAPRMERQVALHSVETTYRLSTAALLDPSLNNDWKVVAPEHLEHVDIPRNWGEQLNQLQQRIGVRFVDETHLKTALIHHGAVNTPAPPEVTLQRLSNRSLEFLGDSILGMAIASYVFQSQPRFQEGQLTQLKAAIVNNQTLSRVAIHDLEIEALLVVGKEHQRSTARPTAALTKGRNTILAGAVEALIAAVYIDQGLLAALTFVNEKILPAAMKYMAAEQTFQPVVELQNLLQAHGYGHPVYKRVTAPLTSTVFRVELFVRNKFVLAGEGTSYKEARINAAAEGYAHYQSLLNSNPQDA